MFLVNCMKRAVVKTINRMVPVKKNSIFAFPSENCEVDNYDIVNYSADTILTFLNYLMQNPFREKVTVYLVVYHPDRIPIYRKYTAKAANIRFVFIPYWKTGKGASLKSRLNKEFKKMQAEYYMIESIPYINKTAGSKQFQICLGYFASCKSDYVFKGDSSGLRKFCTPKNVMIAASSPMDAVIKSAAYGPAVQCFQPVGLTRNDLLKKQLHKEAVFQWLKQVGYQEGMKLVLYAPTYRDYERKQDVQARSIWGDGYDDQVIDAELKKHNILVIAKLHPWQNRNAILGEGSNTVLYKPSFAFSFYDLMAVSDVMITDYSSIGFDWLLMDKPLIYNLYDLEKYRKIRGLAYEPYEDMCGGAIVKNTDELIQAIIQAVKGDNYQEKQKEIKDVMWTRQNFDTCSAIKAFMEKEMDKKK